MEKPTVFKIDFLQWSYGISEKFLTWNISFHVKIMCFRYLRETVIYRLVEKSLHLLQKRITHR